LKSPEGLTSISLEFSDYMSELKSSFELQILLF